MAGRKALFKILVDGNVAPVAPNDVDMYFPRLNSNKEEIKYYEERGADGALYRVNDKEKLFEKVNELNENYFVELADKIRTTKTGKLNDKYAELSSREYVQKLTDDLVEAAEASWDKRFWYEKSYQSINNITYNNEVLTDKFAQLIAVYSPQTNVKANTEFAARAFNKWAAGEPLAVGENIGRFTPPSNMKIETPAGNDTKEFAEWKSKIREEYPKAKFINLDDGSFAVVKPGQYENIKTFEQDYKAEMIMNKDFVWEGRKTNNFYNNLMDRDGITADLWMARAFGFEDDKMIRNLKYDFIEGVTNNVARLLSNKYGIEVRPQQAQAAIWITHKAARQGVRIDEAGLDYADFLNDNYAQISWKTVPSTKRKHLNGISDLDDVVKADYHVAVSKIFLDNDGRDKIAKTLNMLSPGDFEAPGMFEGVSNPSTQTIALATRVKQTGKTGASQYEIAAADKSILELYSAIKGIALKQDSVGYHKAIPPKKGEIKHANAIEIDIQRPLNASEMLELEQLLENPDIALVSSQRGVKLLNLIKDENEVPMKNKDFHTYVETRLENFSVQNGKITYYAQDGGLVKNENYEQIISNIGSSDLQRRVANLLDEITEAKQGIDRDYATEYGLEFDETEYDYIRELIGKINTQ